MHALSRRTRIAAGTFALVIAAVPLAAGTANAGTWGGTLSCPSGTFVKATGYKGGSGPITVSAPGHSYTDSTTSTGFSITVKGASYSGSWSVNGSGATSGSGFCGT